MCTSPQTSTTIRVIDTGQPTSQFSPDVSELGSHISPAVNGVSVYKAPACNSVKNTNTIATSCIQNVSAHSETSIDASQYNELSVSKCSDSSKQVAVPFIRDLDEYFTLRKPPRKISPSISIPFSLRSICKPTTRGKVKYIFVFYDVFYKYVKLHALILATTKACLNKLLNHYFVNIIKPR